MSLIAVNVLMDPDAESVRRARAVNERLRADYPRGFALDEHHVPHVTLVQAFIGTADVAAAAEAVAGALAAAAPVDWRSKAAGYYSLDAGDIGLAGIVFAPTGELRRAQLAVAAALSPFIARGGTSGAFAPRRDGAEIGQATIDYVDSFTASRTGANYNPHLTIGIGSSGFLAALKAEPFESFPFEAQSISLYQLGDYGVAQRKLHDICRC